MSCSAAYEESALILDCHVLGLEMLVPFYWEVCPLPPGSPPWFLFGVFIGQYPPCKPPISLTHQQGSPGMTLGMGGCALWLAETSITLWLGLFQDPGLPIHPEESEALMASFTFSLEPL